MSSFYSGQSTKPIPVFNPRDHINIRSDATVRRYLDGMERQNELIPGGAAAVLAAPGNRVRQTFGNAALDRWIATVAYLAGDGRKYLNAQHVAIPNEPAYKAVLRRLGLPEVNVTELVNTNAVEFAGRTGGALLAGIWRVLDTEYYRTYLGYTLIETVSRPTPDSTHPDPTETARKPKPFGSAL